MKQYLVRKRFNGKAHHWTGNDTECRMASTGGLSMRKYIVTESTHGLSVCHMCQLKAADREVQPHG